MYFFVLILLGVDDGLYHGMAHDIRILNTSGCEMHPDPKCIRRMRKWLPRGRRVRRRPISRPSLWWLSHHLDRPAKNSVLNTEMNLGEVDILPHTLYNHILVEMFYDECLVMLESFERKISKRLTLEDYYIDMISISNTAMSDCYICKPPIQYTVIKSYILGKYLMGSPIYQERKPEYLFNSITITRNRKKIKDRR